MFSHGSPSVTGDFTVAYSKIESELTAQNFDVELQGYFLPHHRPG